jgi:carboxyl-terminal processing protease
MSGHKSQNRYSVVKRNGHGIRLLVVSLLVAFLLAACGDETALTLPTVQSPAQIVPVVPSPTLPPTTTPEPPTPDVTATPAPTITPRPTVSTTPAPLDAAAELKLIKAAYDAINKSYYTQPDTAELAQKALEQTAQVLGLSPPDQQTWQDDNANWQLFEQRFNVLLSKSKLQLPPGQLAHTVVNAMASAVGDLHTYFLDVHRADTALRMSRGDNSTVGFGLYFIQYQGGYYIQRLVTAGPGQVAGVKVGDKLVSVDGTAVTADTFSNLSRTQEGKSYRFVFERPGNSRPVTLKIESKRYKVPTAEWQLISQHIGFIVLNAFQLDVQAKLDEALADLKKQGVDSLIIDLRFNGGGYNFERVAGRFIKDGTQLGQFVSRSGTSALKTRSDGKLQDHLLPTVVLIDRNSASASEIFSLAVRDFKVGTLIGNKTAGAIGTVRFWPLGDGTMLGVTNAVYQTEQGEKLNGIGVTPDITVVRSTADILAGRDPQLEAAIKHLDSVLKAKP